jgi:hypothetical protein
MDDGDVNEMGFVAQMAADSGFKSIEVDAKDLAELVGEIRKLRAEVATMKAAPGVALLTV